MYLSKKMPPLPTPKEMQKWDNAAIQLGIPEFTLMENASREALYILKKLKGPLKNLYVLIFMGAGNNGGDAAALARHLLDVGAKPLVLHTKGLEAYNGTCAQHMLLSKKLGVEFIKIADDGTTPIHKLIPIPWQLPHIIIDGLLGTGFEGNLRPPFFQCITHINKLSQHSFILSLDIPSGCNAINGEVKETAVKAHATVCFAAAKPGLVLPWAKQYTGELYVRNIGIPNTISHQYQPSFRLISSAHAANLLKHQPQNSHKNTWGHVLVLGGSLGLCGAAHLAARAALRCGAGLVSIAAPQELCSEIKLNMPDIMTLAIGEGIDWPENVPDILQQKLPKYSTVVIGPGIGITKGSIAFAQNFLSLASRPRAIIDADALNILSMHPHLLQYVKTNDVLTPHPGEAARLLKLTSKEIQSDRINSIKALTKLAPCVWVLKGAGALLAQHNACTSILPHDIINLAVAGSGDVLSGCIAAFAARDSKIDAYSATALGMIIHAHSGYLAQKIFPNRGNLASDLVEYLPSAMANILNFPEVYCADF